MINHGISREWEAPSVQHWCHVWGVFWSSRIYMYILILSGFNSPSKLTGQSSCPLPTGLLYLCLGHGIDSNESKKVSLNTLQTLVHQASDQHLQQALALHHFMDPLPSSPRSTMLTSQGYSSAAVLAQRQPKHDPGASFGLSVPLLWCQQWAQRSLLVQCQNEQNLTLIERKREKPAAFQGWPKKRNQSAVPPPQCLPTAKSPSKSWTFFM